MLRIALFLVIFSQFLFASHVERFKWSSGESFLLFLERLHLPQSIYYDLDGADQTLTEEIISGINYQILYDENQSVEQVLIPVSDELQLHIITDKKKKYKLIATPIVTEMKTHAFMLKIERSPYLDIVKQTGSTRVAQAFVAAFKNSLNFKRDIQKGDTLVMIYDRLYRMGKPFGMPDLEVAMIELNRKKHYIYKNTDDRYYDEKGHEVEGLMLGKPVRNARITSRFTKRRYHPILKRYRAHLGVDFGARSGTPIQAAGSGKIIFAGKTRGYGNLIKIRHQGGYVTLYAHQRSFRKGIRRGRYVKKGQTIGYVGSTGMSTGPHLHFGLYKNGRAINPASVIKLTSRKLSGNALKSFKVLKKELNAKIQEHIDNVTHAKKYELFKDECLISTETCEKIIYKRIEDETL